MIATDKFAGLARQSAEQERLPGARLVRVAHPIGGIPRSALSTIADGAVEDVLAAMLGTR